MPIFAIVNNALDPVFSLPRVALYPLEFKLEECFDSTPEP